MGSGASSFQAAYNDLKDVMTVRISTPTPRVLTDDPQGECRSLAA
jgi:hypothetical protein